MLLCSLGDGDAVVLDAVNDLLLHVRSHAMLFCHACIISAVNYTRLVYEILGEGQSINCDCDDFVEVVCGF